MTGFLFRARRIWDTFWFEPDSARSLAFIRVGIAIHSLWILGSRDYTGISGLTDFWAQVPMSLQWRYLLFPGHEMLEGVLRLVAMGALVGAIFGVFPRTCCFVSGVLIYHIAPLEVLHHESTPYAMGLTLAPTSLLILSFSRSGDALVLWRRGTTVTSNATGVAYGWPRRLIWLLISQIYLFSAFAKLMRAGIDWGSVANMRSLFLRFGYFKDENLVFTPLALWIADQPYLLQAIGIGTLVFEWLFVAVLFLSLARRVLVPTAIAFGIAVAVTMGIHVGETWLVLLFLNFEWMWSKFDSRVPGRGVRARNGMTGPNQNLLSDAKNS